MATVHFIVHFVHQDMIDPDLLDLLMGLECLRGFSEILVRRISEYASLHPLTGRFIGQISGGVVGSFSSAACSKATRELYVLDIRSNFVHVFSLDDMRLLRSWNTVCVGSGHLFGNLSGICVDDGTNHVIVSSTFCLREFKSDGTYVRLIYGPVSSPQGVSVDSERRLVYVCAPKNRCVCVFSLNDGAFVRRITAHESGVKIAPQSIHFDAGLERMFIIDHSRDIVHHSCGTLEMVDPKSGSRGALGHDQDFYPQDVTVDACGEVLAVDGQHIWMFSSHTGAFIRKFECLDDEGVPFGSRSISRDPITGRVFITSGIYGDPIYVFE